MSFVRIAAVVTLLSAFVSGPAAGQDTTGVGAISGVVVDAAGQRVAGVRVCALDTPTCVTSDAQGAFRIGDLRAGSYRLEILPLAGLPFTSDPVDVRAGLDGTVEVTLPKIEGLEQSVTVTAPAFQVADEVKNSGFLVEPRQILKSAAALQYVSRYVQGLPRVVICPHDAWGRGRKCGVVAGLSAGLALALAGGVPAWGKGSRSGAYSVAQADEGARVYARQCATCRPQGALSRTSSRNTRTIAPSFAKLRPKP